MKKIKSLLKGIFNAAQKKISDALKKITMLNINIALINYIEVK